MKQAVRRAIGMALAVPAFFAVAGVAGTANAADYGTTVEVYDDKELRITAAYGAENKISVELEEKEYDTWYLRVRDEKNKLIDTYEGCKESYDYGYESLLCPVVRDTRIDTKDRYDVAKFDNSAAESYAHKNLVVKMLGGSGDDYLMVTEYSKASSRLEGQYGNDTLYGGAGNDRLFGGYGNDYLYDTAKGYHRDSYGTYYDDDDLFGGEGNDRLNAVDGDFLDFSDGGEDASYRYDHDECKIDKKGFKADPTAHCEKVLTYEY